MNVLTIHDGYNDLDSELYDDLAEALRSRVTSPSSVAADQSVLRHLIDVHGRSVVDLMPCSARLEQLHLFEHAEARYGLITVDHVHM